MCTFDGGERREVPSVGFYFPDQSVSSRSWDGERGGGGRKRHNTYIGAKQSKPIGEEVVWIAHLQSETRNLKGSQPVWCEDFLQ